MVQFAQAHFGEIFGRKEHSLFLKGGQSSAKKIFCETNSDFFSFLSTHKTVGMFSGNATDWESYYIRSISFLKSYQHRGIYQAFLGHLLSVLKENGVKRVDIHIAPNNPVSLYIHLKHGFLISGSVLSENWGVMTQLTKFLDHNSQLVFESQFCTSSWNPIQKLR
ncbi:MAG: GNAT family N-acetyltransferase [Deltaproteobacteria bacterium]|nr:GNAT family N-acetyltransferase [Deltaproteobacteria bacterium]MBI3296472.1 GNAT family N-acetyltransferase [Deltaproteobacteria bacterium]